MSDYPYNGPTFLEEQLSQGWKHGQHSEAVKETLDLLRDIQRAFVRLRTQMAEERFAMGTWACLDELGRLSFALHEGE